MLPTLLETLQKTVAFFEKKGVPQARLSAEWLFAEALGCKRLDLYLRYTELMPEAVLVKLREWVARRGRREPWQYIVGHTPFLEIELKTDARALIPRPETEMLVATLLENASEAPRRILDLGTGSGAIALSLAHAYPEATIVAVDKSVHALALAKENAVRLNLDARVEFLQSDWFAAVTAEYDWIIANPPYLTPAELLTAEPEVKDYEPLNALVAAEEGRQDLDLILQGAYAHLKPGGLIALEMGISHGDWILKRGQELGYIKTDVKRDLTGRARFFFAQRS